MHIGFLTPEYVTQRAVDGGLANYLKKVVWLLTRLGHKVTVFVLSDRNDRWQDGKATIVERKGFSFPQNFRRIKYARIFFPFFQQTISAHLLAQAFRKEHSNTPLDILQASSHRAPGLALLRNRKVPLVSRVSSYAPLLRMAQDLSYETSHRLRDRLEVFQVLNADAAFSPSHFMARTYKNFEQASLDVIRSPFHLEQPESDSSYYNAHLFNNKYLLYFGTLNKIKGVDLIADIIPSIINEQKDIKFAFIGRDEGLNNGTSLYQFISSKCHDSLHSILFSSAIPKSMLLPVIANAYGIIIPSRVDNYPNTCLEAQSMGIPVVGTDNSSLEEMIEDGKTGFLATNGNSASLCGAVRRLINLTPTERQKMRDNIVAHVRSQESENPIVRLVEYYESTISKFRG